MCTMSIAFVGEAALGDPLMSLAGLLVGGVVGLTGVGGGALLTPILVLGFGVPPVAAVSSDVMASLVMKPIGGGVHLRRGTVDLSMVGWLCAGSVPAAFVGAWTISRFKGESLEDDLRLLLGITLLVAATAMLAKAALGQRGGVAPTGRVAVRPLVTIAIGMVGGLMVGLTSVGAGSLIMVLLLVAYPRLSATGLVGVDLVQAVPLVAAAALGHLLFGDIRLDVTLPLLLGAIPGVYLGARASARAPDHHLRPVLIGILLAAGSKLVSAPWPVAVGVAVIGAVVAYRVPRRAGRRASEPAELLPPPR